MLAPIRSNILFVFKDSVDGNRFTSTTESGIIIRNLDNSLSEARWCKVLAVGPEVVHIKPGDEILIEPLKWTEGFVHDEIKVWVTTEEHVMCVKDSN